MTTVLVAAGVVAILLALVGLVAWLAFGLGRWQERAETTQAASDQHQEAYDAVVRGRAHLVHVDDEWLRRPSLDSPSGADAVRPEARDPGARPSTDA